MSYPYKTRFRKALITLAYSRASRLVIRSLIRFKSSEHLSTVMENRGAIGHLNALGAAPLRAGQRFAKVSFTNPAPNLSRITIFDAKGPVYRTEQNTHHSPISLTLQNVVTTTTDKSAWACTSGGQLKVSLSRIPFSTAEQRAYDRKYGIRQQRGVFHSKRGNALDPKRLVVTFPPMSKVDDSLRSRIAHFSDIESSMLSETLIISVQNRFVSPPVSRPTRTSDDPVADLIRSIRHRYSLSNTDILFFGSDISAADAESTSRRFPGCSVLLVDPESDFDSNGVDGFDYSLDCLRSNSLQRLLASPPAHGYQRALKIVTSLKASSDVSKLTTWSTLNSESSVDLYLRNFDETGTLNRATVRGLVMAFVSGLNTQRSDNIEESRFYDLPDAFGCQFRVSSSLMTEEDSDWFVSVVCQSVDIHYYLTNHRLPFVKFTSIDGTPGAPEESTPNVRGVTAINRAGMSCFYPLS